MALDRLRARFKAEIAHAEDVFHSQPDRPLVVSAIVGEHATDLVESYGTVQEVIAAPESAPWPPGLPLPLTVADAVRFATAGLDAAAAELAAEIEKCARLVVPAKMAEAVLAREHIAARWPIEHRARALGAAWSAFASLDALRVAQEAEKARHAAVGEGLVHPSHRERYWPGEVAPLDAAEWARKAAERVCPGWGDALVAAAKSDKILPGFAGEFFFPAFGLGLIYLAWRDVDAGRRRPTIAIDASRPHHELVRGWTEVPKDTRKLGRRAKFDKQPGDKLGECRVELIAKGERCVQLTLKLPGEQLSEALVRELKEWRGWMGLRNWAALQRLLSVEGNREGWVRWTLDAHMNALGYSPRARESVETQRRVAQEVELFTELELAVYDQQDRLRERRPLVHVGSKFDRLHGSEWRLEGMELRINALLYQGVRDNETGKLGSNYGLAAPELPQVDHARHPHTIALGIILPIRWRLAWGDRVDHVRLKGASLLHLAGIAYSKHDPARAWDALERDLEELRRIGGLGRWAWEGPPRESDSIVVLHPPEWARDRLERGVAPLELPPAPSVLTGTELRKWRDARGLTQVAAAEMLGVSVDTVKRGEARGAAPLTRALVRALTAKLATPPTGAAVFEA